MFDPGALFAAWLALAMLAGGFGGEGLSAQEAAPPERKPGHSSHGEAFDEGPRQQARLMEGTGKVSLSITTKAPQGQAWFDQGLGQIHGFWWFEAERSFRQLAMLDHDCAMAYWGMALANGGNEKRAKSFIAEAHKRKEKASPRERKYIEALHDYHHSDRKEKKDKAERYVKALEQILYDFPDELEAKSLLVVALWEARDKGIPISSHLAIDALMSEIFAVAPMHPSHHYRVHLWDHERAQKALKSAAVCGQTSPAIAHMWHMSGHIFSDLERYDDAAWQQEAAARVDHAYMIRDAILPDQIHNYAHNSEWLIRDLYHTGRVRDGIALAKNLIEMPRHPKFNTLDKGNSTSSYGRKRLFDDLERFEMWDDVLKLAQSAWYEPQTARMDQVDQWRRLGIASFHTGQAEMGEAWTRRLEAALSDCDKELKTERDRVIPPVPVDPPPAAGTTPTPDEVKKRDEEKKKAEAAKKQAEDDKQKNVKRLEGDAKKIRSVLAEVRCVRAWSRNERANALTHLSEMEGGSIDPFFHARMLIAVDDREAGLAKAREAATGKTNQTRPLAQLVEVLWRGRAEEEARKEFETLRNMSSAIDLSIPVYARLAPIAGALGLPEDWRKPAEPKTDVGERPALDTLGPYLWSPPSAPGWTGLGPDGQAPDMTRFQGKPTIVVLYLGASCLHCTEQLQAFAKKKADFDRLGIELVGLSTDGPDDLRKSLEAYAPEKFPFPLFSDASLTSFRALRAHDDFEKVPLHGTYFVDAAGRLRWWDIGAEPFMNVDFLRDEAARLLRFEPASTATAGTPAATAAVPNKEAGG
jgi:peroxiredoxin